MKDPGLNPSNTVQTSTDDVQISERDYTQVTKRKKRNQDVPPTARPTLTVEKYMQKIEKSRNVEPPKSFIIIKVGE